MPNSGEKLNYTTYLELERLLSAQHPRSDPQEHDEMLFIVIHQVYELWFKLLLHEFDRMDTLLRNGDLYRCMHGLKRVRTVMKTLVSQIDILETMTPMSFAGFRDWLETASGFQSLQFRELEYLMGYKRAELMSHHEGMPNNIARLQARIDQPTIMDAFYRFLAKHNVEVPVSLLERDVTKPVEPCPELQRALIDIYRNRPEIALLLELMTDFDEGMQEWRYRHLKMVERTIGVSRGTGGSSGVAFLQKSLFKPLFEDLWVIRHEL